MVEIVPKHAYPKVQLSELLGEWVVRIVEKRGNSYTRTFQEKGFAESFAEGQRLRLGLEDHRCI